MATPIFATELRAGSAVAQIAAKVGQWSEYRKELRERASPSWIAVRVSKSAAVQLLLDIHEPFKNGVKF